MSKITHLLLFVFINSYPILSSASDDFKDVVGGHGQLKRINTIDPVIIDNKCDYKNILRHVQSNCALIGLYLADMLTMVECMSQKNLHSVIIKTHKELYIKRHDAISNVIRGVHYNGILIFNTDRPVIKYVCNQDCEYYNIAPINCNIESLNMQFNNTDYNSLMESITNLQDYLATTIEILKKQSKYLR